MKLLALLLVVGAASAAPSSGKIVGGEPIEIKKAPWQLSLEVYELLFWAHTCGASIVGKNTAITAGHCAVGQLPILLRFRAGSADKGNGTIHHIKSIKVHPNFVSSPIDFDIAIMTVKEDFEVIPEEVEPIPLAETEPEEGDIAFVTGWGTKHEGGLLPPEKLQGVEVPIVDRKLCAAEYNSSELVDQITENMICAGLPEGGKDSCQGDSGGPLVVNGTLAGIVSWGEGCARPERPGVYTNVAKLRQWIEEEIAKAER